MTQEDATLRIVQPRPEHRTFVGRLAARVFARFGDYERMLPQLMLRPEVHTWIAVRRGRPLGFVMLSTELADSGETDLTAIAVAPEAQGEGIGRTLLTHAEVETLARLPDAGPAAIRLTVARDNGRARRVFAVAGYEEVPGSGDGYPRGQPSLTLRKSLRGPAA